MEERTESSAKEETVRENGRFQQILEESRAFWNKAPWKYVPRFLIPNSIPFKAELNIINREMDEVIQQHADTLKDHKYRTWYGEARIPFLFSDEVRELVTDTCYGHGIGAAKALVTKLIADMKQWESNLRTVYMVQAGHIKEFWPGNLEHIFASKLVELERGVKATAPKEPLDHPVEIEGSRATAPEKPLNHPKEKMPQPHDILKTIQANTEEPPECSAPTSSPPKSKNPGRGIN